MANSWGGGGGNYDNGAFTLPGTEFQTDAYTETMDVDYNGNLCWCPSPCSVDTSTQFLKVIFYRSLYLSQGSGSVNTPYVYLISSTVNFSRNEFIMLRIADVIPFVVAD